MDDKKVRNIPEETVKSVVESLNPDFIKELPASPEEIAKYALRRTEPVISDNISFSLGQAMLANRMSDEEYLMAFYQVVHTSFFDKKEIDSSCAHILVSQTGSGKTNLRKLILSNDSNIVIVNPDLYKKFNPKLKTILKEDPTNLGALTGIDSYDHANNLQNFAMSKRFNLLYECAPSEKRGLIGIDVERLETQGYDIEYHILAIGNLVSSMAVHLRYESDINKNPTSTSTKLTDLSRHDDSYKGVETAIKNLKDSINITVYRRGTEAENYIPQILGKFKNEDIQEILNVIQTERVRSNKAYVFNNTISFQEDFNRIKDSMQKREAPELQFKQLNEIYNRYITYLNYIKYREDNGFCIVEE